MYNKIKYFRYDIYVYDFIDSRCTRTYPILYGESGVDDIEKKVLDTIVSLDGNCLKFQLCAACPFKYDCLPRFLVGHNVNKFSKQERMNMALDTLARVELMNDSEI